MLCWQVSCVFIHFTAPAPGVFGTWMQADEDGGGWEEVAQCLQGLLPGGELAQYPTLETNLKKVEVISGEKC